MAETQSSEHSIIPPPAMNSSDSDPSDPDWKESPPPASPVTLRKRRRSSSADLTPSRKRAVSAAAYNDAYRLLYNESVQTVTGHQNIHSPSPYKASHLGATIWTGHEKEAFFRALERVGRDNLPAIATAVGSKSIPEIRQFLLLLQDACLDRAGKRGASLKDMTSASDISVVCERRLDAAADGLAIMQERFEATQEQKRYGQHWLIDCHLADQIEVAAKSPRASVPAESEDDRDHMDGVIDAPLLQEIPQARLLIPKSFLELSRNVFMNPSPNTSYPWPHWKDLASDLAAEPCMYRTAFRDFHTLAMSITKRIMQTALIQATSRIRSQGWRTKKGVKLYVRSRDIYTAVDLMGLKQSRRKYWRDVPRRCRLRVTQGKHRKMRAYRWDEIEQILDSAVRRSTPGNSDTDTEGPISEAEQKEFRFRAVRSGTPLPSARQPSPDDSGEDDAEASVGGAESDASQHQEEALDMSDTYATEEEESAYDSSEDELEGLEAFDQRMSRLEEHRLWSIVGNASRGVQGPGLETETEQLIHNIPHRRSIERGDDWRAWTSYHAEWEDMRTPVPTISFLANRKSPSPPHTWDPATDCESGYGTETGWPSGERGPRKSRPKRTGEELPLRDARSYAALRGRQPHSAERDAGSDASENEATIPTQSIENANESAAATSVVEDDEMDAMQWH